MILSDLFVCFNSWLFDRNLWARWQGITVILTTLYSSQLHTIDLEISFSTTAITRICGVWLWSVLSRRWMLMASAVLSWTIRDFSEIRSVKQTWNTHWLVYIFSTNYWRRSLTSWSQACLTNFCCIRYIVICYSNKHLPGAVLQIFKICQKCIQYFEKNWKKKKSVKKIDFNFMPVVRRNPADDPWRPWYLSLLLLK